MVLWQTPISASAINSLLWDIVKYFSLVFPRYCRQHVYILLCCMVVLGYLTIFMHPEVTVVRKGEAPEKVVFRLLYRNCNEGCDLLLHCDS